MADTHRAFWGYYVATICDPRNSISFTLRLVQKGQRYGANGVLVAERDLVEFYDARFPDGNFEGYLGQFISRYRLHDVNQWPRYEGLDLDGGNPDWKLCGDAMAHVHDVLNNWGKSA